MSLNVILGASNSGKSEYMYRKIMACEESEKQAILFVPPSGRLIAEEEYLKYTNKKVVIDTLITSIERFVNKRVNKNKLYENKTYLKDLAKKMMVKKTIVENPEMFNVFAKSKDTIGFTDKIADYIQKFDTLQNLEILDKYEEQDILKTKLDEFKGIYLKLQEQLQDKFVQATDEMKEYIKTLNESKSNLLNADVFIDNYNNFSNVEYEFIQSLLLSGNDVYITLDIDKKKHLEGITAIYSTPYDTLIKLKEMSANIGIEFNEIVLNGKKENVRKDILHLGNNIFNMSKNVYSDKVDNVKLLLLPNTYEEIKYVASDILRKIKQGYEYKDIAIYTNNIDGYNIFLNKIFGLYNIPIYINEEGKITSNRLIIYILTLLDLVENGYTKSIDNVLNLLKTGMLNIPEDSVYIFENYLLEFGIRGYNLTHKFELDSGYNLDEINDTRECILNEVGKLKQILKDVKTSKGITEAIYNYLVNENIVARYEQGLEQIKQIDVNEYNKAKQVLAKIYEVMDNICLAYNNISLKEYIELLEYGIKEITVDTVPAKLNQVEVVDINRSRGIEKKVAYLIGCYDGGLPTVQSEDNIFTDIELEKLKLVGIELKQTSDERNNMQLFNIYQAINKVRDGLVITVPSSLSKNVT